MPQVWNQHHGGVPSEAVYVGRPTKWGSPFVIGRHGTRTEVMAQYMEWLFAQDPGYIEAIRRELRGKDLVCFCVPLACHGSVLFEIANEGEGL